MAKGVAVDQRVITSVRLTRDAHRRMSRLSTETGWSSSVIMQSAIEAFLAADDAARLAAVRTMRKRTKS